jgi:hypothetical protein
VDSVPWNTILGYLPALPTYLSYNFLYLGGGKAYDLHPSLPFVFFVLWSGLWESTEYRVQGADTQASAARARRRDGELPQEKGEWDWFVYAFASRRDSGSVDGVIVMRTEEKKRGVSE